MTAQIDENKITVALEMEPGRPMLVGTLADNMKALLRGLRATDRAMHGKLTCDYYLTGFDFNEHGIGYQVTAAPKGEDVRIKNFNHDAPPMVGPGAKS